MEIVEAKFKKYVFVCENVREDGNAFCGAAGTRIRECLKDEVKKRGWASRVRVSRSGCLDVCAEGPNVLIEPDHLWLRRVTIEDCPAILKKLEEGL